MIPFAMEEIASAVSLDLLPSKSFLVRENNALDVMTNKLRGTNARVPATATTPPRTVHPAAAAISSIESFSAEIPSCDFFKSPLFSAIDANSSIDLTVNAWILCYQRLH